MCLYDGPPSPRQCPRGRDELRSRPFAEPALSLTPGRLLLPHTRQRRGRAAASRPAHTRRLLSTSRTGSAIAPSVGGSVPLSPTTSLSLSLVSFSSLALSQKCKRSYSKAITSYLAETTPPCCNRSRRDNLILRATAEASVAVCVLGMEERRQELCRELAASVKKVRPSSSS